MIWEKVLTKEFLQEEYSVKLKTPTDIANEIGCTGTTVRFYLKKFDIPPQIKGQRLYKDSIGKRYGRVIVLRFYETDKFKKCKLECICDCGKIFVVNASSLKRGLTNSCGCFKQETLRKKGYRDISYSFWRRLVASARQRGIEVDISIEDIWDKYVKQNRTCALSGVAIKFHPNFNECKQTTASIDRINSDKGYTKCNIQIVHKTVNLMKNVINNNEFIQWCKLIAKNTETNNEVNI